MNVHAPSDDLNIVAVRISDSINVADHTCIHFFFWHIQAYLKNICTVSIDGERPRERRLPRARYLPQQRVCLHLTCLQYRAKSFRASSQDSLTRYARATVNRGTKFHCDRSALFFRTRELSHVECTWRKWENGKSLCVISGRNLRKNFQRDALYENCILSANIFNWSIFFLCFMALITKQIIVTTNCKQKCYHFLYWKLGLLKVGSHKLTQDSQSTRNVTFPSVSRYYESAYIAVLI